MVAWEIPPHDPVPNEPAMEHIVHVSGLTGLEENTVYDLFMKGWSFTMTIGGQKYWSKQNG